MPPTELGLLRAGLAYFTARADRAARWCGAAPSPTRSSTACSRPTPIVYEDFLPRSAAGIFASNLTDEGSRDDAVAGTRRDAGWLSDVLGTEVRDPYALYAAQQQASIDALPTEIRAALD